MANHGIVMNVCPDDILGGAAMPAPGLPVASGNAQDLADPAEVHNLGADVGEDFWMYLQLRATTGTVHKCLTHLARQLHAHPLADAEIVGMGTDQHTVRVIIGVNLGDSFRIKARPSNVVAAHGFVRSLSAELANFWPQFLTGTPTDEERDLLATVVSAGAIQTRPTMVAGAGLRAATEILSFEPERELALASHGNSWQLDSAVA
jgi:hypothetical protein